MIVPAPRWEQTRRSISVQLLQVGNDEGDHGLGAQLRGIDGEVGRPRGGGQPPYLQVMEPLRPGASAAVTDRRNIGVKRNQHIWFRMLPERRNLAVLLTRDMCVVAKASQSADEG